MPLEQVGLLAQVYGRALTLAASAEPLPAPTDETALAAMSQAQENEPDEEAPIAAPDEDISIITPILPTEPAIIALDAPETPSDEDGEGEGDVVLDHAGEPEPFSEQKETPEPELKTPDTGDVSENDLT